MPYRRGLYACHRVALRKIRKLVQDEGCGLAIYSFTLGVEGQPQPSSQSLTCYVYEHNCIHHQPTLTVKAVSGDKCLSDHRSYSPKVQSAASICRRYLQATESDDFALHSQSTTRAVVSVAVYKFLPTTPLRNGSIQHSHRFLQVLVPKSVEGFKIDTRHREP